MIRSSHRVVSRRRLLLVPSSLGWRTGGCRRTRRSNRLGRFSRAKLGSRRLLLVSSLCRLVRPLSRLLGGGSVFPSLFREGLERESLKVAEEFSDFFDVLVGPDWVFRGSHSYWSLEVTGEFTGQSDVETGSGPVFGLDAVDNASHYDAMRAF